MLAKIFYSWQAVLPNNTNRSFIQDCLERAADEVKSNAELEVDPVIDRDTLGESGAPDIFATILKKIDRSSVFVCDVSIINAGGDKRSAPNPNVLIELGYALKSLGEQKIIMVMNTAFGGPSLLPFDLRSRRVMTYELNEDTDDKSTEKKKLQSSLRYAIEIIIKNLVPPPAKLTPDDPLVDFKTGAFSSENSLNIKLHNTGRMIALRVEVYLNSENICHLSSLAPDDKHQRDVKVKVPEIHVRSVSFFEVRFHDPLGNKYALIYPSGGEQDNWWIPVGLKSVIKNGERIDFEPAASVEIRENQKEKIPEINAEAKTLLIEAVSDKRGYIIHTVTMGGTFIQTNGKDFVVKGDPQSRAVWEGALQDLEKKRLIEATSYKREVFKVTREGYRVAQLLK